MKKSPNKFIIQRLFLCLFCLTLSACQQSPTNKVSAFAIPAPQLNPALLIELNNTEAADYFDTHLTTYETRRYTVTEQLEIVNYGPGLASKNNLWVALIQTITPYQKVIGVSITPSEYVLVRDEHNNIYAEFNMDDLQPGEREWVRIEYEIEISRVSYTLDICAGEVLTSYTNPELRIESNNGQLIALAQDLSSTEMTPCAQARAFYDYVGNELVYTYNAGDWGAQAALGDMGSDCTEYASLFIALCRAEGIPARYLEGLNYRGLHDDVEARLEHAWAEVYLPDIGWVPVDPTLGRLATTRERYFSQMPADHIIVTIGRTPSTLRGNHYFAHLYWGSTQTTVKAENYGWTIKAIDN